MTATAPLPNFFRKHRIAVIMGAVLMFHAVAIWALQSGLLMRAVEMVVPVEVVAQIIEPPKPVVPPPPPPPVVPKEPPPPMKQAVVKPAPPVPQTQAPPQILAVETPAPAPNAPAAVQIAPPAPLLPPSVPVAAVALPAIAPVTAPTPAKVEMVTVDGDYLNMLKPKKSNLSIRMGEHGNVKIKVYVGIDGMPTSAKIVESSGFPRLDELAKNAAMLTKYRPKKVNGIPVEANFDIPFIFERD